MIRNGEKSAMVQILVNIFFELCIEVWSCALIIICDYIILTYKSIIFAHKWKQIWVTCLLFRTSLECKKRIVIIWKKNEKLSENSFISIFGLDEHRIFFLKWAHGKIIIDGQLGLNSTFEAFLRIIIKFQLGINLIKTGRAVPEI